MSENAEVFICIECGQQVPELFKKYSSSVVKIAECKHCKKVADKYIEFEPIIIVIDLVLANRPAYRHVLYNSKFKTQWKLLVVLVLFESFSLWHRRYKKTSDNFVDETRFYMCYCEKIIVLTLLLSLLTLFLRIVKRKFISRNLFLTLLKAVTLASLAKFFLLPMIIWRGTASEFETQIHYFLVNSYFFLCLVNIYLVSVNCHRFIGLFIVGATLFAKELIVEELTVHLRHHFVDYFGL